MKLQQVWFSRLIVQCNSCGGSAHSRRSCLLHAGDNGVCALADKLRGSRQLALHCARQAARWSLLLSSCVNFAVRPFRLDFVPPWKKCSNLLSLPALLVFKTPSRAHPPFSLHSLFVLYVVIDVSLNALSFLLPLWIWQTRRHLLPLSSPRPLFLFSHPWGTIF